jgi:hypothetical protein
VKRGSASRSEGLTRSRKDAEPVLVRITADARMSTVRRHALDIVVFAGILIVGFARLPAPFTGDQALNMLMGRVIADGGAPYVDLWDLKHPGIFLFFAAGGAVFGFTEIGIHLFELVWMLALAVAVRLTVGMFLRSRVAAAMAPALTVGFYYAVASDVHLTQTEGIVGLPLLSSLVFAAAAVRRGSSRPVALSFASGLSAGLVALFKAPYVVLPMIFWALALVESRRVQGIEIRQAMRRLAPPAVGGLLIPVAVTAAYLAQRGALGAAWWTFVVFPRQAAAETPLDLQLLRESTVWFARTFSVPLALAAVGVADRLRRGWDLLTLGLVAWIVIGALLIWAQVIGWWSYHYLLLLVPIGLLAAHGAETLAAAARAPGFVHRRAAAATALLVMTLLSVVPLRLAVRSVSEFVRARPLPLTVDAARAYQLEQDSAYAYAYRTTSFLRASGSHPGPIYVFASPILYVLSYRPPAISPLATWFDPTSEMWERMMTELTAASPPYIYIAHEAVETLTAENPAISDDARVLRSWLERMYRELRPDADGMWYRRRDLPVSAGP